MGRLTVFNPAKQQGIYLGRSHLTDEASLHSCRSVNKAASPSSLGSGSGTIIPDPGLFWPKVPDPQHFYNKRIIPRGLRACYEAFMGQSSPGLFSNRLVFNPLVFER